MTGAGPRAAKDPSANRNLIKFALLDHSRAAELLLNQIRARRHWSARESKEISEVRRGDALFHCVRENLGREVLIKFELL